MLPATRQQKDYPFTLESSIDFDPDDPESKSLTRQESKDDTDVNRILEQYGVPYGRQPIFGDINYDNTLRDAYEQLNTYDQVYNGLPIELKQKYATAAAVMEGIRTGELVADLEKINNPPKEPTQPPA